MLLTATASTLVVQRRQHVDRVAPRDESLASFIVALSPQFRTESFSEISS